jgi:hypothetical protein
LQYRFDTDTSGPLRVLLSGAIDENADLEGLFEKLIADAVINMRDVERVNSIGVHRWVPLVTRQVLRHRLTIEELSYAVVQSANAVANMFGGAALRSCTAPYYCARCNQHLPVLVAAEEIKAANDVPAKQCPHCHHELEFDELDGYFAFFKVRARK